MNKTAIRKGYVDTPKGQIHYRSSGEGEPLVLLHCTSDSSAMWEAVLPILGGMGYRAVAFDIPGHGNSDPPPEKPDGNEYARRIDEAARLLGLGKYNILGHHFGATVVEYMAVNYPKNIKKVIFFGLPLQDAEWYEYQTHAQPHIFDKEGNEIIRFLKLRTGLSDGGHFRKWDLPAAKKSIFDSYMVNRVMISYLQAGTNWYYAYHVIAATAFDHVTLGKKIKKPVLFIMASRDPVPTPEWQDKKVIQSTFPGWDWVKVDGSVDYADENPEEFCQIVDKFIRS